MPTKQTSWEGFFLAFAMIFTVLLGSTYAVASFFRMPVPWLAVLLVSVLLTLGLRYLRGGNESKARD